MAVIGGTGVDVTLGGAVYELNGARWTADLVAEVNETTPGWDSAANWREFEPSWLAGTGTIEARADATTPLVLPGAAIGAAVFTLGGVAGARKLTVDIIITGVGLSAERLGDVTVTWSFQITGSTLPTLL